MGLLLLSNFSSIPNLRAKIQSRREQKERFTRSFVEWGLINGLQVVESTTTQGTVTLFTVPSNTTLYITNAFASISTGSGQAGNASVLIQGGSSFLQTTCNVANTTSEAQIYNKPIKVEAGGIVESQTTQAAGVQAVATGISGFTIPNSLEIV